MTPKDEMAILRETHDALNRIEALVGPCIGESALYGKLHPYEPGAVMTEQETAKLGERLRRIEEMVQTLIEYAER